jgi:hypothetical protein
MPAGTDEQNALFRRHALMVARAAGARAGIADDTGIADDLSTDPVS